eukprot:SAG25_NODE_885_length_4932_cov_8.691082_5_plen_192_part_00
MDDGMTTSRAIFGPCSQFRPRSAVAPTSSQHPYHTSHKILSMRAALVRTSHRRHSDSCSKQCCCEPVLALMVALQSLVHRAHHSEARPAASCCSCRSPPRADRTAVSSYEQAGTHASYHYAARQCYYSMSLHARVDRGCRHHMEASRKHRGCHGSACYAQKSQTLGQLPHRTHFRGFHSTHSHLLATSSAG